MKKSSAIALSFAITASATAVGSSSPVQAGPLSCSFSPNSISATIDPAFFESASDPGGLDGLTPDMFEPVSISIIPTTNIPDGEASVSFDMTVGGEEYGPVTVPGVGNFGTDGTPVDFPSIAVMGFLSSIGAALIDESDVDFLSDFPNIDAFYGALMDPGSYPISVEFVVSSGGSSLCTLTMNLEAGKASTKPCSGPYGHLCEYLEERLKADQALPNTH